MAFYNDQDDEDDLTNQGGPVKTGASTGVIGGSSEGTSGNATSSNGPTAPAGAPDKPGNFVGIKTYLNANKNQSNKLGDQVSGIVNQAADAGKAAVTGLQQEANQKINSAPVIGDDVYDKLNKNAEQLSGDERASLKSAAAAKYTGPMSVEDLTGYSSTAQAVNKGQQAIANTQTEGGRTNLLGQVNGGPRTQGVNLFDNMLLVGDGQQKLDEAAEANKDLVPMFDNTSKAIRGQIGSVDDPNTPDVNEASGAIGQTASVRQNTTKQIEDALNAWKAGFTPKVAAAQQALIDRQNQVTQDVGDNDWQFSRDTLDALGLKGGETLWNLNLGDYLDRSSSPNDINAANTANAQDYARYGALSDLAGESTQLFDTSRADLAGTGPKYAPSKDINADITARRADYDQRYNTQKSGVLDAMYLPNPNSASGYSGQIPGQLTDRRDLNTATPAELESYWIPLFQQASNTWRQNYTVTLDAIQKSLAKWRKSLGMNNLANQKAPASA